MLDIEKVRECYSEYKQNYAYYDKINQYYYGNTDSTKKVDNVPNKSHIKVQSNFVQLLVDEEAQYSFGNKITYSSIDYKEDVINAINYNINNPKTYDSTLGQKLVQFHLVYEINFIGKDGFKNKIVTPLEGNFAYDEYDEPLFFIYVHTRRELDKTVTPNKWKYIDYIDVYDEENVYYLDNNFTEYKEAVPHGFDCIPVGVGMVAGVKYTEKNGYIEGDKTIYRQIKTKQDAYETINSTMTEEILDLRNSILKFYGIKLGAKKDENGNVIVDSNGNPIMEKPVISNNSVLYFKDKTKEDAEWLNKNINEPFIENMLKRQRDDIYSLTSHIDNNEKLQSNLSGIALRSRLQALEAKCKMNEDAMEDIITVRLRCLFKYLKDIKKGDFDYKKVKIGFTPCVPIDEATVADMISKIPHEIASNYTKRQWLPRVSDPDNEQKLIDEETEKELNNYPNLDKLGDDNGEDNE